MRNLKRSATAVIFGAFAAFLLAAPSFAQTPSPSASAAFPPVPIAPIPVGKPGYCAPWHRCVAEGIGAAFLLYLIATAGMWMYQRRGFDSIEPRQGSPRGVPVQKK